jgi:hypothetical protein
LKKRDPRALAAYLAAGFQQPISIGIGPPGFGTFTECATRDGQYVQALLCKDKLASLAVALGILPAECLEQGHWGENIATPAEELLQKVEAALGFSLIPPDACGAFGLKIGERILPCKSIEHGYVNWKIRGKYPRGKSLNVCEIGAGFGGIAYYFCISGGGSYSIFDLPTMNLLQGYYLCKTLGPDVVSLYREPVGASTRVRVLPYWDFDCCAPGEFDIAVNQDSMPEITEAAVENYLRGILRTTRDRFVSINQETMGMWACGEKSGRQIVVPWVIERVGGFRRVLRMPYWLRRGYVEEHYEIAAAGNAV